MVDFRLVDSFTAALSMETREVLLKEFCKCNTRFRLLIATAAFGMGTDIEKVIHWGCPNTLEELFQGTV